MERGKERERRTGEWVVGLVGAGDGNIDGTNWRCFGAKQPVDQKERSTRAECRCKGGMEA